MEKLLDGAPVEWKMLGEVAEYSKSRISSDQLDKTNYVGVDNLLQNRAGKTESIYVPMEGNLTGYYKHDILIGNIRPYLKKIWLADRIGGTNGDVLVIHVTAKTVNSQYLFQILTDERFFSYNMQHAKGAKMPRGNKDKIMEYPIPIPPLLVQAEIVRILDAFTELTTELTAELTARKKQYNYYRDQLLSFEKGKVEWKTLGEVTVSTSNIRWREADRIYRYIDLTSVSRENNSIVETTEITAKTAPSRAQKLVEKDDVIFATTRPTQQRICLISEEYAGEIASTGYCVLRAKTDEVFSKWIFYYLLSAKFRNYVEENQSGSAYPAISDAKVKEFKSPFRPSPNKSVSFPSSINLTR